MWDHSGKTFQTANWHNAVVVVKTEEEAEEALQEPNTGAGAGAAAGRRGNLVSLLRKQSLSNLETPMMTGASVKAIRNSKLKAKSKFL